MNPESGAFWAISIFRKPIFRFSRIQSKIALEIPYYIYSGLFVLFVLTKGTKSYKSFSSQTHRV